MTFDWQIGIVALAVLWAASVVCYRFAQLMWNENAGGCHTGGGCHGCPSKQANASTGLVQLGLPESSNRQSQ